MTAAVAGGIAGLEPGRCWAMAGRNGSVTVRLIRPIRPKKLVLQVLSQFSPFQK